MELKFLLIYTVVYVVCMVFLIGISSIAYFFLTEEDTIKFITTSATLLTCMYIVSLVVYGFLYTIDFLLVTLELK